MRSGESVLPQIPFFQQMALAPGGMRNYVEFADRWLKFPSIGDLAGGKANLRGSLGAATRRKGEG